MLRVSEGDTWQEAFLKVLPERKNARLIVPVQFKEEELQDSKPVDVNNAMPVNISNTVPVDVNNTVTIVKDICDKENDSKSKCNIDLKEILNENLHIM